MPTIASEFYLPEQECLSQFYKFTCPVVVARTAH